MNHIVFLWAALVAICWSIPAIADDKTQQNFAIYAGLFWLLGSLANAANITLMIDHVGYLVGSRLVLEPILGVLFLVAVMLTRKQSQIAAQAANA